MPGPLRDLLRERQRASLVSYLVVRPDAAKGQHWIDKDGLYEHFLIDVEMSPCQLTSRIKQATCSAQLFVQRCLMHLETDVDASSAVDSRWSEWTWMKTYRVWEANRKVFLYPENWIEPELRDDKSPFFKELENELMQKDATPDNIEDAFLHYLESLDAVARLDVRGMYHELEKDSTGAVATDILHVFARTQNPPHIYYYRQRVDGWRWTAWEKLDVDIEGDHLIPIIWERRLHLIWPIFDLRAMPKAVTMPATGSSMSAPQQYLAVRLAWTEYGTASGSQSG